MSNHLNDITKVYLESVLLDEKKKEKKLDPVGQEDGDIDNDGDEDSSDEYLHAKRKAIGKAMGKKDKQKKDEDVKEGKNLHGRVEVPGKEPLAKQVKKAVSNVDSDVDGDTDHNDKSAGNYGEFVPSADGKKKLTAGPAKAPKVKKESVYSWRDSISEFVDTPRNPNNKPMTSDKSREKVVEKNITNTVKINPTLKDVKEAYVVEEFFVEADDLDTIADFVFEELIEEGFDAIEVAAALIEAKVTLGHDTKEPVNKEGPQRVAKSMARIVRRKLKRKVGQKSAEMQVAAYNKGREIMRGAKDKARVAKMKLKRGIKNAALKVADRMSEEAEVVEGAGLYANIHAKRKRGGKMRSKGDKGAPTAQDFANAAKTAKEEVEVHEAKRPTLGQIFADRRNKAHREAGYANDQLKWEKRKDKKEVKKEEVEMDEAMRPGPRQRAMAAKQYQQYKKGGGTYSSRDRATAHNVAVRNDGPGTPGYEKKSTGGKGARFAGYGDQGAGNKARRRMGQEPMRGNTRKEEVEQLAANLQEKAMKCWDTHKKVGMKMKGGKLVNDCRPKNESVEVKEDGTMAAPSPQQTNLMKQRAMMDAKLAQLRRQQLAKDQSEKSKMKESTEDSLRDRRMERGGVAGNVDYRRPPKNTNNEFGKKKPSGKSAFDLVKADLEKKYGKGAIISNKRKG